MKCAFKKNRLLILLIFAVGIGLSIPLVYHKVAGGTPLGLGIVGESIGFPIVFAIAVSLIECMIARYQQNNIATLQKTIPFSPDTVVVEPSLAPNKSHKANIVMNPNTGAMDLVLPDQRLTATSGAIPIIGVHREHPRRDYEAAGANPALILSPTLTLATLPGDGNNLLSSQNPIVQPLLQNSP